MSQKNLQELADRIHALPLDERLIIAAEIIRRGNLEMGRSIAESVVLAIDGHLLLGLSLPKARA